MLGMRTSVFELGAGGRLARPPTAATASARVAHDLAASAGAVAAARRRTARRASSTAFFTPIGAQLRHVLLRRSLVEPERLELGGRAHAGAHAHRLHRAVHSALVEREQVAGNLRDALRDREHLGLEPSAGNARLA